MNFSANAIFFIARDKKKILLFGLVTQFTYQNCKRDRNRARTHTHAHMRASPRSLSFSVSCSVKLHDPPELTRARAEYKARLLPPLFQLDAAAATELQGHGHPKKAYATVFFFFFFSQTFTGFAFGWCCRLFLSSTR